MVAIIFVIMYHASVESYGAMHLTYSQFTMYWWTSTIYESLVLPGVPLFVMLSGALLLQTSKTNEPIRVLLKKRLSRIGYAFAFWTAIYLTWTYFVDKTPVTIDFIVKAITINGAYYHFWFLYLIAGLYLATPVLRVLVAHADLRILRYMIILWFISVAVLPLIQLISGAGINGSVFVFGGYIGYFILGVYLMKVQLRSIFTYGLLLLSIVWTIAGTWLMAFPFHSAGQYYFYFYTLSANIVIASVAIFLILSKFPANWPANKSPRLGKVVHAISENTLPIYLLHVIILESLERGYFGFTLSLTIMNPVWEAPLATAVTLFICLGLVLLMKKVPVLKKLIG